NAGKRITGFSPDALQAMAAYNWPGNIRELQNCALMQADKSDAVSRRSGGYAPGVAGQDPARLAGTGDRAGRRPA
ncbi:hypothetical protein ACQX25_11935, partial [Corynebacterium diphtheriae]